MASKRIVLVTRTVPGAVTARLERDYEARLNREDRLLDSNEVVARAAGADALLPCPTDKLTAQVIDQLPASIRVISTFSVGYEHIDLAAAKRRGIVVTNTPEVLTDATADCTMLLLLGAARRAHEGERMIREATWTAWAPTGLLGVHVTGKRLGIYGMGRIGKAVAQRARGFEMKIHYSDPVRLSPELEAGATYHADPNDMLPHCDFLTIHSPSTPETYHYLNKERIARLPDGAVVVNAARGTIVDDGALIAALKSGKLTAAGLDVYENEPNINPGYRTLPNTFLLPHFGSATVETRNAMGFKCLDNLDAFFAGREPPDRVA